jgi:hypothetical protein
MWFSKLLQAILITQFLLLICGQQPTSAQQQPKAKITLKLVSQTPQQPVVENGVQRFVLEDAKGVRTGRLISKQGRRVLALQGQAEIELPHDLPAVVSRNGSVVIQYGDTQDLSHPRITHFYWLDAEGKETGRLEGYFRADAVFGVSDDGFTAVAGSRVEAPHPEVLALFSPNGQQVWLRTLESGLDIVTEPMVALQGERVAVVTCNAETPLKDHRILILDGKNKEIKRIDSLGLVQRMVIVGQSKAIFVQGRDRYGLIDLSGGTIVWTQPGNVRLISPSGASLSPDGTLLFLLLADWSGKSKAAYPWRLKVLDATDGQDLGMVAMPKPMAGTRADLFGRVGMDQVEIITDEDQLTVSIGR